MLEESPIETRPMRWSGNFKTTIIEAAGTMASRIKETSLLVWEGAVDLWKEYKFGERYTVELEPIRDAPFTNILLGLADTLIQKQNFLSIPGRWREVAYEFIQADSPEFDLIFSTFSNVVLKLGVPVAVGFVDPKVSIAYVFLIHGSPTTSEAVYQTAYTFLRGKRVLKDLYPDVSILGHYLFRFRESLDAKSPKDALRVLRDSLLLRTIPEYPEIQQYLRIKKYFLLLTGIHLLPGLLGAYAWTVTAPAITIPVTDHERFIEIEGARNFFKYFWGHFRETIKGKILIGTFKAGFKGVTHTLSLPGELGEHAVQAHQYMYLRPLISNEP